MDNNLMNWKGVDYEQVLNDDILVHMGKAEAPAEEKQQILSKMMETIENRVLLRVADDLSGEEAKEFEAYIEKEDRQGAQKYLEDKGIDIPRYFVEESIIYKTEMMNLFNKLRSKKEKEQNG